ncbi:hypothetical protein INT43_005249 [Umbelopsis isabellina]|uniref:Uncharacterized protein n=1 Tax=Mortierella isabellina TaxID=91625 RepID=A0A8H7UBU1_MORIS|nr:hypothetical protein INT43_005249 [Umbelopsis isabellina]
MAICGDEQKHINRKIVVCGDYQCGKTSLLNVMTTGYFGQLYEPAVFDCHYRDATIDGQEVGVSMVDTKSTDEHEHSCGVHFSNAHVILMCFAVDNRESLDNIMYRWLDIVQEYRPNVKIVLVALKCDLRDDEATIMKLQQINQHPVLYEEGLATARSINAVRYLECSAKHNRGVNECFEQAAKVAMSGKYRLLRKNQCRSLCS